MHDHKGTIITQLQLLLTSSFNFYKVQHMQFLFCAKRLAEAWGKENMRDPSDLLTWD